MDCSSSDRYEYDGVNETIVKLNGSGDFRSEECVKIKDECDIVVTNPPFSMFREFINWLIKDNGTMRKFLIIGNVQSIKYKEVFPLLKDNKMWIGCSSFNVGMRFMVPNQSETVRVSSICWYTNLDHMKRHVEIKYCTEKIEFKKYDNYDAIDVPSVKMIPDGYYGVMGVPITFMGKYNPYQFDIIDLLNRYTVCGTGDDEKVKRTHSHMCNIDGKPVFSRILIKRKQQSST